jgi:hypothetical protein
MLRHRSRLRFELIASASAVLLCATAHAQAGNMSKRQITEQISKTMKKVRIGKSSVARTDAAEHLSKLTEGIDPKKIDDTTIANMVSLLDTSEDSVRYWVACALGNLGTRAKIAIPKLQQILAEVDCLQQSMNSASGIRFALEQMGVTPVPPSNCEAKKE